MNIKSLQKYYSGFEIAEPIGNNAFSHQKRHNKCIYIAPLVPGTLSDVQAGTQVVFSEFEDGVEKNRTGLKKFIYHPSQGKDIFVFDNHNHAFFFWMAAYLQGKIEPGLPLVHVDQHSDMREPLTYPPYTLSADLNLKKVFEYTNYKLNVGNFIKPALKLNLFSDVKIIDSSTSFQENVTGEFVLDIDLDVFSEEMAYIDKDYKIKQIKKLIARTNFITIATSPYFIDQQKAIAVLNQLLSTK